MNTNASTDSSLRSNELFASALRPNPVETEFTLTTVEGEIPRELNGTLYRNGPNQNIEPAAGNRALHLFDGDALVHAIRFEDGSAHYRGRFARTESFLREEAEGVNCQRGLNLAADHPLEIPLPGHAPDTNIVPHAGRLFAMAENMPPFEMDPVSLESKELWNDDGKMLGLSTTAHPKIDARTGQIGSMAINPSSPTSSSTVSKPMAAYPAPRPMTLPGHR